MTSRLPPESQAKLRVRVEHFFDVVARLLAKRWLREQQHEENDDKGRDEDDGSSREPLKS